MSLFVLVALAGYFGVNAAVHAASVKAQVAATGIRSLEEVEAAARFGYFMFLASVGALALARFIILAPSPPLEIVMLVFVIYLALDFGKRASKLRFQRDRVLGVDFPRKKVLIPAVVVMIVLFLAFVFVKDLGATLILSALFLA